MPTNNNDQGNKRMNISIGIQATPNSKVWKVLNYLRSQLENGKLRNFLRDEFKDFIEARFYGYVAQNQANTKQDNQFFVYQIYGKLKRWSDEIENLTGIPNPYWNPVVQTKMSQKLQDKEMKESSELSEESRTNQEDEDENSSLSQAKNELNKLESMF
jgi:hypothetical protein